MDLVSYYFRYIDCNDKSNLDGYFHTVSGETIMGHPTNTHIKNLLDEILRKLEELSKQIKEIKKDD